MADCSHVDVDITSDDDDIEGTRTERIAEYRPCSSHFEVSTADFSAFDAIGMNMHQPYQFQKHCNMHELRLKWFSKITAKESMNLISPDQWRQYDKLRSLCLRHNREVLEPGVDVEMEGSFFVRIFEIAKTQNSETAYIRGLVFVRSGQEWTEIARNILAYNDEEMGGYLREAANELHISVNLLTDTPFSFSEQALRIFPVTLVRQIRKIRITDRPFPQLNPAYESGGRPDLEREGDVLICRWIATKVWSSEDSMIQRKPSHCHQRITVVCGSELVSPDPVSTMIADKEVFQHRKAGGSSQGIDERELIRRRHEQNLEIRASEQRLESRQRICTGPILINDLDELSSGAGYLTINTDDMDQVCGSAPNDEFWRTSWEPVTDRRYPNVQRYTFADIFCGCGGASVAAVAAGMDVRYAVDIDKNMCIAYHLNHPAVRLACTSADVFVSQYKHDKSIDILHLSFPCQPYSKAHTTAGRNDEVNRQALAVLESYIQSARPRIVTIEEADGLGIIEKHHEELQRIIYQLTSCNYSVEFKIVPFVEFGICQRRSRLVIIASCPGQRLPGFPSPTHIDPSQRAKKIQNDPECWNISDLPDWVGIREAIEDLPPRWSLHDPANPSLLVDGGSESCPTELAPTVIVKNSGLMHWEGWRKLTVREKLLIQGFPVSFEFPEGQARGQIEKQIGNAVPPKAFTVILKHIQRELLCDDAKLCDYDESTGGRIAVTAAFRQCSQA